MKLYKYAPASVLSAVLRDQSVSIKFDHPANYNDPLELFLTPRGVSDDFTFAFYHHLLGELPQMPTTCFSRRPDTLPMWAHYADDHTGFLVEFDEERLIEHFEAGYIQDVEYKTEIGFCDTGVIHYAAQTGKPRHVHRARSLAFTSAYFTKNTCWAYEAERRLVMDPTQFPDREGLLLMEFPASCVTALIAGCRMDEAGVDQLRRASMRYGCRSLHLRLGKSVQTPYFIGDRRGTCAFDGSEIELAEYSCGSCGDLTDEDGLECRWCSMTEADAEEAALSDPMRLFAVTGIPHPYGFSFAGLSPVGTRYAE